MNFVVAAHEDREMSEAPFEVVERKGRGHPDTICDLVADRVSQDLAQFYVQECGRVLHYNVDKAMLVGGRSEPRFGGGTIIEPAKFYLGDRAVSSMNGYRFDLDSLIERSISSWLDENLRFLRLNDNLIWCSEIREGAATLNAVEGRNVSNDTSVGVSFWPLSAIEEMTLAIEHYMNSSDFKKRHPAAGEDIKVMAIRHGNTVETVIACALVDGYIADKEDYEAKKADILGDATAFIKTAYGRHFDHSVSLNNLDDSARGLDGLYLTVSGLSCEGGDSGEVGRGNRVNGLISFLRPQTMEAWAGKNFKSHIGRIYSFAAQNLARTVTEEIPEVKEATVLLVGKIGFPVERPAHVFGDIKMGGARQGAIQEKVASVLKEAIEDGAVFRSEELLLTWPTLGLQTHAELKRSAQHDA